jgi:hypothetical protein
VVAAIGGALGLVFAWALATRRAWAPDALVSYQLLALAVMPIILPVQLSEQRALLTRAPSAEGVSTAAAIVAGLESGVTALLAAIIMSYLLTSRRVARVYRREEREQFVPGWLRALPDAATAVVKRTGAAGFVVLLTLVYAVVAGLVAAAVL